MELNQAALDLIKSFESLRLDVYKDPVGIPTVGWGHVVKPHDNLHLGDVITLEQAEEFLKSDLAVAETDVERTVIQPLTPNQYGALVSFTFNTGRHNLQKLLKNGVVGVPALILHFNHADGHVLPGLTRRRRAERDLFLTT